MDLPVQTHAMADLEKTDTNAMVPYGIITAIGSQQTYTISVEMVYEWIPAAGDQTHSMSYGETNSLSYDYAVQITNRQNSMSVFDSINHHAFPRPAGVGRLDTENFKSARLNPVHSVRANEKVYPDEEDDNGFSKEEYSEEEYKSADDLNDIVHNELRTVQPLKETTQRNKMNSPEVSHEELLLTPENDSVSYKPTSDRNNQKTKTNTKTGASGK